MIILNKFSICPYSLRQIKPNSRCTTVSMGRQFTQIYTYLIWGKVSLTWKATACSTQNCMHTHTHLWVPVKLRQIL